MRRATFLRALATAVAGLGLGLKLPEPEPTGFTERMLKEALEKCWQGAGEPFMLVGTRQGLADAIYQTSPVELPTASHFDVYPSDFGMADG